MAEKKGLYLTSIQGFPVDVIQKLSGYWITTAEELVGAALLESGLSGLVNATNLPQDEVVRLVELARSSLPPKLFFAPGDIRTHGMGALDTFEPEKEDEEPVSFAPLPTRVDLHDHFGPVRDQGRRGTCVAHACAAAREFLTGQQSKVTNFSEQFLYWDCKKHDLIPGEGTFIRVGMNRLEFDGIPDETDWPYNPSLIPNNEGQSPPPDGILSKASPNRIQSFTSLNPTRMDSLRHALAAGSAVVFSVPVYAHWFTEPTHSSGDVRIPLPGEKVEGGHALCMVGYETDPDVPGGGYFLVRNSWGIDWAGQSPVAAGYARIPFAYMAQYGNSAYIAMCQSVPSKPKSLWQRIIDWFRNLFG
jgi:C1A family cysteine protease